jgi:hypothetical protein
LFFLHTCVHSICIIFTLPHLSHLLPLPLTPTPQGRTSFTFILSDFVKEKKMDFLYV